MRAYSLVDLELLIMSLPPISRGAPISDFSRPARALAGPWLHADRLMELWHVADDDGVPLSQAFRLLDDIKAVYGAILRTVVAKEYPHDPRYWTLPPLEDLLPELQETSWQFMLSGALLVEGIKGLRGKKYRIVQPLELPRLRPDWSLSRLCRGENDEFVEVRVRRAPSQPVKARWRKRPSEADLKAAILAIAETYPAGSRPGEKNIRQQLVDRLGPEVTRDDVRYAIKEFAPQLRGKRGYRSTT